MMLVSNVSSLESSSKDFRMNRCAIKAKHRSIVPTPSRLLVDDILEKEQMNESNEYYAGGQPNKIRNVEKNSPINYRVRSTKDELSRDYYLFGKSRRTEDIFIREDENGIRSHYCPLIPGRDGEKNENEECPDHPMQIHLSLEELLNKFNLPSEEIYTYLEAEKPPQFGSEESDNSSTDSYTSPEYSPLENQSTGSDNSPMKFQEQISKAVPDDMLDKNTMKAWTEDSSDELDNWDTYKSDYKVIQSYTIGNESDMEEFERDSSEEYGKKNLNSSKISGLSFDSKSLESETKNESDSESFNNLSKTENLEADISKNCQTSDLKAEGENENEKKTTSDSDYSSKDEHCATDDSRKETESNHNSEEEEENKNKSENPAKDSVKKVNWTDMRAKRTHLQETANSFNKTDENHQDYFSNSCSEIHAMETTKDTSEGNEAKLTMEPIGMNISRFCKKDEIQPDLIKELPIMTEVCHTKEDELFSEAFSTTDEVDKISVNEKSEVPDKLQDLIDLPVLKAVRKSSTLEQALIKDDQKVAPKSQNKLMKFFQSFKRKFERTKKA